MNNIQVVRTSQVMKVNQTILLLVIFMKNRFPKGCFKHCSCFTFQNQVFVDKHDHQKLLGESKSNEPNYEKHIFLPKFAYFLQN